ncbi:hypothetical protein Nmel_004327 [Mimus melanotis]
MQIQYKMESAFLFAMRYVVNLEQISVLLVLHFPGFASAYLSNRGRVLA